MAKIMEVSLGHPRLDTDPGYSSSNRNQSESDEDCPRKENDTKTRCHEGQKPSESPNVEEEDFRIKETNPCADRSLGLLG